MKTSVASNTAPINPARAPESLPNSLEEEERTITREDQADEREAFLEFLLSVCANALLSLTASVFREATLTVTEYRLLLALTVQRAMYLQTEAETKGVESAALATFAFNPAKLFAFPLSLDALRESMSPTNNNSEGSWLKASAVSKAAKGLEAKGLITCEQTGREIYSWQVHTGVLAAFALSEREDRRKISWEMVEAVAHLLEEEKIRTAQAAVLIPLRIKAMLAFPFWSRHKEEKGERFSLDATNLQLEQMTGVNRKTAQKVLKEAALTEGLGVWDWVSVGRAGNRQVFRATFHSLSWDTWREREQVKEQKLEQKEKLKGVTVVPLSFPEAAEEKKVVQGEPRVPFFPPLIIPPKDAREKNTVGPQETSPEPRRRDVKASTTIDLVPAGHEPEEAFTLPDFLAAAK